MRVAPELDSSPRYNVRQTFPPSLPTNTRPPIMVGCANAKFAPGNPKAHFSLRRARPRREFRRFRRLEAPLRAINTPPVPMRYTDRVGKASSGGWKGTRTWRNGTDFLQPRPRCWVYSIVGQNPACLTPMPILRPDLTDNVWTAASSGLLQAYRAVNCAVCD
jgi:hypothetical protein